MEKHLSLLNTAIPSQSSISQTTPPQHSTECPDAQHPPAGKANPAVVTRGWPPELCGLKQRSGSSICHSPPPQQLVCSTFPSLWEGEGKVVAPFQTVLAPRRREKTEGRSQVPRPHLQSRGTRGPQEGPPLRNITSPVSAIPRGAWKIV